MVNTIRHIALVVPDLRSAEEYYQTLFSMELLGRETKLEDGEWYQIPIDKGWEETEIAGIEIKMLALRKDSIVIALFLGDDVTGQVFSIGLTVSKPTILEVGSQLPSDVKLLLDQEDRLHFIDRYGIMWQLELPEREFTMNGVANDRWLEM